MIFEYFIATATTEGNKIEFKTLVETGNAGFNIWRAEKDETGKFINMVKLNLELIPAQEEPIYHFVDANVDPNTTNYYAIEDVNTDGISKLHEELIAVLKPDNKITSAACLIYGIHDRGLNNSIAFSIDPEIKAINQLGKMHKGTDVEAIAVHPTTKMIYVASGNDTRNYPQGHLYKIDAKTGELISVGHTGFEEVSDLVFNNDGTKLWAWVKNQGMVTINSITGVGTLEIPSDILGEGFSIAEGNFYGSVNTQLWKYAIETETLEIACSNLPGETESLTAISDGLLLIGLHNNSKLKVFDPNTCKVVESISSGEFDDVEAIVWPSCIVE